MRKQALKKDQARFMSPAAIAAHRERVARMGGLISQQEEIDKALRILARKSTIRNSTPEALQAAKANVAKNQAGVTELKRRFMRQANLARTMRGLFRHTLPRTAVGAGVLGAAGLGAYGIHKLVSKDRESIPPPEPAMVPFKRNKVMDAIYRVLNVDPNFPGSEVTAPESLKGASDRLVRCWAEGFDKYCHEQGVDSEELVAALAGVEKRAIPVVTPVAGSLQGALEKLWQKLVVRPFIFDPRKLKLRVNAEGGVFPPKLRQ